MARSRLSPLRNLHCAALALLLFSFAPTSPHIDDALPVTPAATEVQRRWPLVCDPTLRNVVQFRWVAAEGEVTGREAVEAQLRNIAEQVNWLFWRDSDSYTEARLPAWKITPDCRLDVRFDDTSTGGTVPPLGGTKLIQIEPDDSYCGYAFLGEDDRPGADNIHNGSSFVAVARRCLSAYVVAHELLHSMGAVQPSAPHGLADFHSGEFDIMGRPEVDRCGVHDMIDCGRDDYFSLRPRGYLAERWNVANSVFLIRVGRVTVWVPLAFGGV